jgi:glycosidase
MLATFLLALRGTIYLYQGQEIGLTHPENWNIDDYKDVETQNYYRTLGLLESNLSRLIWLMHR